MSPPAFEAFLARLYVDDAFRAGFIAGTLPASAWQGLDAAERAQMEAIDRVGLQMMCDSLRARKSGRSGH